jgi:hypothetical protein
LGWSGGGDVRYTHRHLKVNWLASPGADGPLGGASLPWLSSRSGW